MLVFFKRPLFVYFHCFHQQIFCRKIAVFSGNQTQDLRTRGRAHWPLDHQHGLQRTVCLQLYLYNNIVKLKIRETETLTLKGGLQVQIRAVYWTNNEQTVVHLPSVDHRGSSAIYQVLKINASSPGLFVKWGDSISEGCEFESHCRIQGWTFFHIKLL